MRVMYTYFVKQTNIPYANATSNPATQKTQ